MNTHSLRRLLAVALMPLFAGACGDSSGPESPSDDILAIVDGDEISVDRFTEAMHASMNQGPRNYGRSGAKEELLWKIIDESVVAAHARMAGYEKDPEIVESIRYMIVRKFLADRLEPKLAAVAPSEEELQQFYDENVRLYRSRGRVRPAIIWMRKREGLPEEELAALRQRAAEAREKALAQGPEVVGFGEIAREYSQHVKSRGEGGVMGWLVDGSPPTFLEEQLVDAVFLLENEGDISEVVETESWLYIVKLVERELAKTRNFLQVRDAISTTLTERRRREVRRAFLDELRENLGGRFEMNKGAKEMLEKIEPPMPPSTSAPGAAASGDGSGTSSDDESGGPGGAATRALERL